MGNIVSEWYETKKNVDEMVHWEKPKLKNGNWLLQSFYLHKQKF